MFVKTHSSFFFFHTLQLLFSFCGIAHRFLSIYTHFVRRMKYGGKNKPPRKVQRAVVFFRGSWFTDIPSKIFHWEITIAPKHHRMQLKSVLFVNVWYWNTVIIYACFCLGYFKKKKFPAKIQLICLVGQFNKLVTIISPTSRHIKPFFALIFLQCHKYSPSKETHEPFKDFFLLFVFSTMDSYHTSAVHFAGDHFLVPCVFSPNYVFFKEEEETNIHDYKLFIKHSHPYRCLLSSHAGTWPKFLQFWPLLAHSHCQTGHQCRRH